MRRVLFVLALLAPLAASAEESARGRVTLFGSGMFAARSLAFSESRTFTEFAETAHVDSSYSADSAAGFDVGVQFDVTRHIGVRASAARARRDRKAAYTASLPHPLYFDKPRTASGELPGSKLTETGGHLDLVLTASRGKLDVSAWGGVSRYKVETELLTGIEYSQSYPYDSVSITATPTIAVRNTPTGFNVGAGLDYRIARHFGVGAQIRYGSAKAKFNPSGTSTVEIEAGGLQAGGGVRLYF